MDSDLGGHFILFDTLVSVANTQTGYSGWWFVLRVLLSFLEEKKFSRKKRKTIYLLGSVSELYTDVAYSVSSFDFIVYKTLQCGFFASAIVFESSAIPDQKHHIIQRWNDSLKYTSVNLFRGVGECQSNHSSQFERGYPEPIFTQPSSSKVSVFKTTPSSPRQDHNHESMPFYPAVAPSQDKQPNISRQTLHRYRSLARPLVSRIR